MDGEQLGGQKPVSFPIHYSNVNLVDPETQRRCKIKYGYLADGTKVRVSKKSGMIIPKPVRETLEEKYRDKIDGEFDTPTDLAHQVTYKGEDFCGIKQKFEEQIREKENIEALLVFPK